MRLKLFPLKCVEMKNVNERKNEVLGDASEDSCFGSCNKLNNRVYKHFKSSFNCLEWLRMGVSRSLKRESSLLLKRIFAKVVIRAYLSVSKNFILGETFFSYPLSKLTTI